MAAAPVESCQSLSKRSPWGRLGSVSYTCKRLHRMRRRFKHFWSISLSRPLHFSSAIRNLESAQTLQSGTHDCAQLTGGSTRGHDPAAKSARRLSSGSVHNHTSRQNRFWAATWTRASSGSPRTPRGGTAATPRGAPNAAGSLWAARSTRPRQPGRDPPPSAIMVRHRHASEETRK